MGTILVLLILLGVVFYLDDGTKSNEILLVLSSEKGDIDMEHIVQFVLGGIVAVVAAIIALIVF